MPHLAARADERKKLERLCRYISRPAVSEKRLSLTRRMATCATSSRRRTGTAPRM